MDYFFTNDMSEEEINSIRNKVMSIFERIKDYKSEPIKYAQEFYGKDLLDKYHTTTAILNDEHGYYYCYHKMYNLVAKIRREMKYVKEEKYLVDYLSNGKQSFEDIIRLQWLVYEIIGFEINHDTHYYEQVQELFGDDLLQPRKTGRCPRSCNNALNYLLKIIKNKINMINSFEDICDFDSLDIFSRAVTVLGINLTITFILMNLENINNYMDIIDYIVAYYPGRIESIINCPYIAENTKDSIKKRISISYDISEKKYILK